jgi:putative membrane protein
MDNAVLPWNIVIRYFLNGSETAADELAGKSGKLKIQIKITENVASNTDFFDNYALQLSMTLDGEKCNDISASTPR